MGESHVQGELSLREVQLASLEILKRIDAVCREEGIRYWLMYGTLIGAVRHKGFIPWDDDLDIAMPRDDYERFIDCFPKKKELESLVEINPELGKNRPFLITRVSDPVYKMIGEYGDLVDGLGTFVDIYPLDGLGSSMETAIQHKTKAYGLVRRYLQANNFEYNNRGAGAVKRAAKSVLSLMRGEPSKYQEELDKACTVYGYDDSEFVANLHWTMTPDKSIYERSWFDGTVRLRFEDMEAPVPRGYDPLLRVDYGDYMQLPPEGERVGHHYYSIVRRTAQQGC